jgi:hypothetical protein
VIDRGAGRRVSDGLLQSYFTPYLPSSTVERKVRTGVITDADQKRRS